MPDAQFKAIVHAREQAKQELGTLRETVKLRAEERAQKNTPADQEFRATYKHAHDCHIVVVEQYDGRNAKAASWKVITNLFCVNATLGSKLAEAITNANGVKP